MTVFQQGDFPIKYETIAPVMPCKQNAKYLEWKGGVGGFRPGRRSFQIRFASWQGGHLPQS